VRVVVEQFVVDLDLFAARHKLPVGSAARAALSNHAPRQVLTEHVVGPHK
jgi:hypothetical protein